VTEKEKTIVRRNMITEVSAQLSWLRKIILEKEQEKNKNETKENEKKQTKMKQIKRKNKTTCIMSEQLSESLTGFDSMQNSFYWSHEWI